MVIDCRQGLWTLNGAFFHLNPKLFGQTIWVDNFWDIWGIFGRLISIHFGTLSPLSMLNINEPLLLEKLSLYIHIPKTYLIGTGI